MKNFVLICIGFLLGVIVMVPFAVHRELFDRENDAAVSGTYTVTNVVDGDTIDVRDAFGKEDRVRLVGIDTPETVDQNRPVGCFGPEATLRMKELVEGETVTLQNKPDEDRDTYGRLLRYVFLGDRDIGAVMIEEGYAVSLCKRFPHARCTEYDEMERAAKAGGMGRWGACT